MWTAQTQRCWKHLEFPHNQSIAEHGITKLQRAELWSVQHLWGLQDGRIWKLGSLRLQLWELSVGLGGERTSCQRESMRTITSSAAGGAACLGCLRKLLMRVLSVALGKALTLKTEEQPAMSMGWRDHVQTQLQRVHFTEILKHRCVLFCHPTTWFWVLSFPPAIFFLHCNYCWECDPACWLWCHAHFLCRSWCRQPFWVADGHWQGSKA